MDVTFFIINLLFQVAVYGEADILHYIPYCKSLSGGCIERKTYSVVVSTFLIVIYIFIFQMAAWFDKLFSDVSYPSSHLRGILGRIQAKAQDMRGKGEDLDCS